MKKTLRTLLFVTPFVVFIFSFFNSNQLQSSSSQPPAGYSKDLVNNNSCTSCHNSYSAFSLDRASITIGTTTGNQQPLAGFQYTGGTQYVMTFSVIGTATKYGFQMTALAGTTKAGNFAAGSTSTLASANGIGYIGHKNANGTTNSWTFNWTAPTAGTGNVTFYYTVNKAYNPSGTSGDSIFHRSLTITEAPITPPSVTTNRDTTICAGNAVQLNTTVSGSQGTVTYSWQPSTGLSCSTCANPVATPSQTTSYIVTAAATNGSAKDTVLISVNSNPSAAISGSNFVCNGSSVQLTASGGTNYSWNQGLGSGASKTVSPTTNTTYSVTVTNAAGCVATANKTIEVRNSSLHTFNQTICQGSSFSFKGKNLTQAGTYRDTLTNAAGCDSFVVLNLAVNPILQGTLNQSICQGGSFFFKGQNLTQAGTYKDTLKNQAGCDSIITLNLSINNVVQVNLVRAICQGDSVVFKGIARKTNGIFADTTKALGGCDSITTLNLTVNANPTANAGNDRTVSINCPNTVQLGGTPTATGNAPFQFTWNPATSLNNANSANPLTSNILSNTTFTVTVSDKNNCTASSSVSISTIDLSAPIIQNGNVLTAPQQYLSYQWLKNGAAIPAATDSTYTVTETGNYSLLAQGTDGCKDTSNVVSITISSISETSLLVQFNVYPNPAKDKLNLVLNEKESFVAEILTANGALLQTVASENGKSIIDISKFESGIYLARVTNGTNSFIKRFIVIK
jgi:hypothetical protein